MKPVTLHIEIPVCSFRKGTAREFLETETFPPPSTVYGFLLSLVGEEDRSRYQGAKLALAMETQPRVSRVLRKNWRVKNLKIPLGLGENAKPDILELLVDVRLWVWIAPGPLADRVKSALADPSSIERFGGLSLGESHDLVNVVKEATVAPDAQLYWLERRPDGQLPVTVWVDHVGASKTRFEQAACVLTPAGRVLEKLKNGEDSVWFEIPKVEA